jgi:hypothetical protein
MLLEVIAPSFWLKNIETQQLILILKLILFLPGRHGRRLGWAGSTTIGRRLDPLRYRNTRGSSGTNVTSRNTKWGKYHCTIDLLFGWFGISSMTTVNFCFYLQNRLIQTSKTGGQRYIDTSPFSIPWLHNNFGFYFVADALNPMLLEFLCR